MFPQGGNETDLNNFTFQSSLQKTETRYFVLCKSSHVNFPYSVDLFKIPDIDEPFWKGHIEAGLQNNF